MENGNNGRSNSGIESRKKNGTTVIVNSIKGGVCIVTGYKACFRKAPNGAIPLTVYFMDNYIGVKNRLVRLTEA